MTGEELLGRAAKLVRERRKTYGDPAVLMANIAARWSLTLSRPVTPAQVALCLIDLKLTRLAHDPSHFDSTLDLAGYAAVLREVVR